MLQFQKDLPGEYFKIEDIKEHHNKTLAHWKMRGQGTSLATLSNNGLFTSFLGFF